MTLTAIVAAGGKAKPDFAAATGVANRALVELSPGRTMLDFVLDALDEAATVGRVFVVGDVGAAVAARAASGKPAPQVLAPGKTLIDNLLIGFNAAGAGHGEHMLLVGSDIPFVNGGEIDDFARDAVASGADFCYPIIPMSEYRRQYGKMRRTTLRVREGEYTGGNIMLMRAGVILENPAAIHAAHASRKSVVALGGLMGWGLLARIVAAKLGAARLLSIPALEGGVGRVLGPGVAARAIVTPHTALGTDVDKPDDVAAAREILARR